MYAYVRKAEFSDRTVYHTFLDFASETKLTYKDLAEIIWDAFGLYDEYPEAEIECKMTPPAYKDQPVKHRSHDISLKEININFTVHQLKLRENKTIYFAFCLSECSPPQWESFNIRYSYYHDEDDDDEDNDDDDFDDD